MIPWRYLVAFERMKCGIARRLGHDIDLLKSAADVEELYPAKTISGPATVALPHQYERIRAVGFGSDLAKELAEVQGASRTIGPTVRYVLEDVLINNNIIYARGKRTLFNYTISHNQTKSPWLEFDEVALRSSFVGCHFFGHWLRDDCATHLLAEEVGPPMSMPTPAWPDRIGYLELFGQEYAEIDRAYVKQLVLFYDICNNPHKVRRLRALRARIAKDRTSPAADRIVYVRRGPGGIQRPLLNEMELVDALTQRGIAVVQAEVLSVPQLVSELFGARMVISVEGSQLSHALLTLRDDAGVLVIQPPDQFVNSHMDWARALNMRYGIVVGEQRESGFYLPVDDLSLLT